MLEKLNQALRKSYSADLCYPPAMERWSEDNPTFGMCSITSLVVQDYLGGEICKVAVGSGSHYFNVIDGKVVDLTAEQFGREISYDDMIKVERDEMLPARDTKRRYLELKHRVEGCLAK